MPTFRETVMRLVRDREQITMRHAAILMLVREAHSDAPLAQLYI